MLGDRQALVPEWRWCIGIGTQRRGIVDQDIKMTVLGFHSLEEGLDLCVICMIAYNGNANSACLAMESATSLIVPGVVPGLEAVVRPVT
jgi:hypothetical protein